MPIDAELAIVIPVHKARFLRETLDAISNQSVKRFKVYIGDDASPDDVESLCDSCSDNIDMVYHRFEENLGNRDLVAHWERCIALSDEPWVWLFCDDDLMDPDCVSSFYKQLKQTDDQFDLYRFNTRRVDAEGQTIYTPPEHPPIETPLGFICDKLSFQRDSFVSEYIFSREVHAKNGGFVNFPLAWCADDATWIRFGEAKGICTIPESYVYWRESESNVSMGGQRYHEGKLRGLVAYVDWLNNQFSFKNREEGAFQKQFVGAQRKWFLAHLGLLAPFGLKNYFAPPQFPKIFSSVGMVYKALILLRFDFHYYINNVKQYYCALLRK